MGSMPVLELTFKADSIWPLWYASGPDVVNLDECKHRRFFLYISQKLICSVFLYTSFRDPFRPGVLWRTSPWGPQRWALTTLYVSHIMWPSSETKFQGLECWHYFASLENYQGPMHMEFSIFKEQYLTKSESESIQKR